MSKSSYTLPQAADARHYGQPVNDKNEAEKPYLRVSPSKTLGVVFTFVLLMVIFITNVPLRGMWSVLVIVVAISLVVFFILLGWIDAILHRSTCLMFASTWRGT